VSECIQGLLTVIIPAYNHEQYVAAAINSVLSQDYDHIELIVIDDVSSDATFAVANSFSSDARVTVLRNDLNMGPSKTLNKGIQLAKGEFIAILASDDMFAPAALKVRTEVMTRNATTKLMFSDFVGMSENGALETSRPVKRDKELLSLNPQDILTDLYIRSSPLFVQSGLFRTDFLRAIGGFDESLLADDWALCIRAFRQITSRAEYEYLDSATFYYRSHQTNINRNYVRHKKLKEEVISKYCPNKLKIKAYSNLFWELSLDNYYMGRYLHTLYYCIVSEMLRPHHAPFKLLAGKLKKIMGTRKGSSH